MTVHDDVATLQMRFVWFAYLPAILINTLSNFLRNLILKRALTSYS